MNLVNPYRFTPPVDLSTNTEIGGVSASISTSALLAAKLAIDVSRISNFLVVGSDIKCRITGNYVINWESDVYLKSYVDKEGLVTDFKFRGCINFDTEIIFNGVVNLMSSYTIRSTSIPKVTLINCTYISNNSFYNGDSPFVKRIYYMPKCINLGGTNLNDSAFYQLESGSYIYVNPYLKTNNSGTLDGDLSYVISRGANARFVTNLIVPNSMNNLSIGNVYARMIQLIDNGTSANNIDYYEKIKINGVVYPNVNVNEYIYGLTPNTNYTIEAVAVDICYNKSALNIVSQQTNQNYYVPTENLISYYKMEANALDSLGVNHAAANNITYQNGLVGQKAIFNGSSSFISMTDVDAFSFSNGNDLPFSFSVLASFNDEKEAILFNKITDTYREYLVDVFFNRIEFKIYDQATGSTNYLFNSYAFTRVIGKLYHLVFTYDGSGLPSGIKTYIDTVEGGSKYVVGSYVKKRNTTSNLVFGKFAYLEILKQNGTQDEIAIFNKALNSLEVSEIEAKLKSGQSLV